MVGPKHHRGFSFGSKSSKSHQSNSSGNSPPIATEPVTETAEDKVRRSLKSKADPTVAMSELQPSKFFPCSAPPPSCWFVFHLSLADQYFLTICYQWRSHSKNQTWGIFEKCRIKISTAILSVCLNCPSPDPCRARIADSEFPI